MNKILKIDFNNYFDKGFYEKQKTELLNSTTANSRNVFQ